MSTYGSDSIQLKIEIHSGEMMRRDFNPANHDLDPSFRLTRFADLKGKTIACLYCRIEQILFAIIESSRPRMQSAARGAD